MTDRLFVYGTLKQGFFNHHINQGQRVPGEFVTAQRFPLFLVTDRFIPWLVNAPGEGEQVVGQVYEVGDAELAEMDVLERVTEPGWYTRVRTQVLQRDDPAAPPLTCWIYLGDAGRVQAEGARLGPLAEYTQGHAELYLQSIR